jgi:hypothetical protein
MVRGGLAWILHYGIARSGWLSNARHARVDNPNLSAVYLQVLEKWRLIVAIRVVVRHGFDRLAGPRGCLCCMNSEPSKTARQRAIHSARFHPGEQRRVFGAGRLPGRILVKRRIRFRITPPSSATREAFW